MSEMWDYYKFLSQFGTDHFLHQEISSPTGVTYGRFIQPKSNSSFGNIFFSIIRILAGWHVPSGPVSDGSPQDLTHRSHRLAVFENCLAMMTRAQELLSSRATSPALR